MTASRVLPTGSVQVRCNFQDRFAAHCGHGATQPQFQVTSLGSEWMAGLMRARVATLPCKSAATSLSRPGIIGTTSVVLLLALADTVRIFMGMLLIHFMCTCRCMQYFAPAHFHVLQAFFFGYYPSIA